MSQLRVNEIVSEDGTSTPSFPRGISSPSATIGDLQVTGVTTTTGLIDANGGIDVDGDITATGDLTVRDIAAGGSVSVAGTITYEDVTSVNAVGIITAEQGINVTSGGINVVGVVTATAFEGDGTNLVLDYQDLTIRNWMFGPG